MEVHIQNRKQWEEDFIDACRHGHLDLLRHLCLKMYRDQKFSNISIHNHVGFRLACQEGQIDIIQYLLTSPELLEAGHTFADLHAENEQGLREACAQGHLDVVKYLLTSTELLEAGHTFADLHAWNDFGFCWACENEHWNVVKWLVMDYGIEKTPAIEEMIQNHPQAQEYFRIREERDAIQESLQNHDPDLITDLSPERSAVWASKKIKKL